MTSPATDQRDETDRRTIELPATESTQRALHEAIGHLYDELAATSADGNDATPASVFDGIEELYVATAEESVSRVELSYELED